MGHIVGEMTSFDSGPQRFVVEILPTADGRVVGSVRCTGEEVAMPFSGWLDLLRLLEPVNLAERAVIVAPEQP